MPGGKGRTERSRSCRIPNSPGKVVAVSAGAFHALALTRTAGSTRSAAAATASSATADRQRRRAGAGADERRLVRRRHLAQRRGARRRQRVGVGQQRQVAAVRRHDANQASPQQVKLPGGAKRPRPAGGTPR